MYPPLVIVLSNSVQVAACKLPSFEFEGLALARKSVMFACCFQDLLGRAQPVIPPNLYSLFYFNEHNSLGSPGNQDRS